MSSEIKARQEKVFATIFIRGDRVKYVTPMFRHGILIGTRLVRAAVETECTARPGWYYVREHESGDVQLVQWMDLMKVDDVA